MPLILTAPPPPAPRSPPPHAAALFPVCSREQRWNHDLLRINTEPSPKLSGKYIGLFHTQPAQKR